MKNNDEFLAALRRRALRGEHTKQEEIKTPEEVVVAQILYSALTKIVSRFLALTVQANDELLEAQATETDEVKIKKLIVNVNKLQACLNFYLKELEDIKFSLSSANF